MQLELQIFLYINIFEYNGLKALLIINNKILRVVHLGKFCVIW